MTLTSLQDIPDKKAKGFINAHQFAAMQVAEHTYFVIHSASRNETAGLLVGQELKKIRDVEQRPSKYWNGDYYSVLVECPSGETRRVSCDALLPRKNDERFLLQQKSFSI